MSTLLKNVTEKQSANIIDLSLLSFEGLKDLRKQINMLITQHEEYKAPIKAEHIQAKKDDMSIILNEILGKSAAYKKIVSLHNDGRINLRAWSNKPINEVQLTFVLKSFKNLFYFTSMEEANLSQTTPQKIGDIILRAATMKPENFTKAISRK